MSTQLGTLPLSPALLEVVAELGYDRWTPVQARSIPVLLAGQDLVGQSKTGSGKTAAFCLPILDKLCVGTRTLQALILCPTRELCAQVAREMRKLGRRHKSLQVLVVAGGEPFRQQANALEKGVHVMVGTPGRVLDHLSRGTLPLEAVGTAVLDEADRMLDMGFQQDMERILGALPKLRQTVFFSATFPTSIEALSRKHQREPVRVTIDEAPEAAGELRQLLLPVEPTNKLKALRWVLQSHAHEAALVFANLKSGVAEVERALSRAGSSVGALHGDLEQVDRDRVMAKFRNGSTRVLIATDVAARGLDVESLDLVVNFDLPSKPEVYVHRIGRTGRAGRPGAAISFAHAGESARVRAIEQFTGVPLERIQPGASDSIQRDAGALQQVQHEAKMDTLKISGGRKQKMRPGDILGALTGEAGGLAASAIGKIEIHENFSFVAVSKQVSHQAQRSLSTGRIKGKRFLVCKVE